MLARLSHSMLAAVLGLSALGASAQDILIGQIGPFTVMPTRDPSEVRDGAKAYFDQLNRNGGVRGHKISLFTLDDAFNGDVFMDRFKEAMAKHPLALISPIGSAAVGNLLKSGVLDTADIVVLGAIPGAEAFRQPGHAKLFHVRAGDKAQLHKILLHCKTLGITRIHVLRQDVAVGEAGLAVVLDSTKAIGGLTITSSVARHDAGTLQAAAKETAAQAPKGVIVIGIPGFMADAVAQLRTAGLNQATFALSYLSAPLAVKAASVAGARGLGITQAFPNPNGQNLPIQREFQAAMVKSSPEIKSYSPFHLEGFITARLLATALRRVEGNPTPAALAKALHEMGEVDLGGFIVNFSKGNVGSAWTDIGVMSATGKLMY